MCRNACLCACAATRSNACARTHYALPYAVPIGQELGRSGAHCSVAVPIALGLLGIVSCTFPLTLREQCAPDREALQVDACIYDL